jgi:hypothetical protein
MNHGLPQSPSSRVMSEDGQSSKPQAGGFWDWLTRLPYSQKPELDSLNRALMLGLIMEVMLENPRLQEEPGFRRHRLKACLRSFLASQLAGRISLASFQSLAQGMDRWFEVLYPVLADANLAGHSSSALAPAASSSGGCPLQEDLFCECLERTPGLLPKRRHRKFDREKLQSFLESTKGEWFRLQDFEAYFHVDRKTAWEYAQKLLQVGLLVHNQGQSSAVRYRVAPRFLKSAWGLQPTTSGKLSRATPPYPEGPFQFKC